MNTILIKGADFSSAKVGKLDIQKITIEKAGDGYINSIANDGTLDVRTGTIATGFIAGDEYAYSNPVLVPAGAKYLFGKINISVLTTRFANFLNGNFSGNLAVAPWFYENPTTGVFDKVSALYPNDTDLSILRYKSGVLGDGNYTIAMLDGGIFARAIAVPGTGSNRAYFNWVKNGSASAPEIGMEVPELYWGF